MTQVLEAQNLAYAYEKGHDVFADIDGTVRAGNFTGIVGPNGSGKSTLLRILSGLIKPRTGRVTLDGQSLRSLSGMERARRIAFLPQSVNPAFALSVIEVVCLGRYPHVGALAGLRPLDLEVAERCLHETATYKLRDRPFMSLSGGERQRVLLASVLAQEPGFLLLDEPTSALDIHHQIDVFALLRRLADDGYGVAVVTHDLNLAARFCDDLMLLAAGHGVVASGTPADVLTEAQLSKAYEASIRVTRHPVTEALLISADAPERVSP